MSLSDRSEGSASAHVSHSVSSPEVRIFHKQPCAQMKQTGCFLHPAQLETMYLQLGFNIIPMCNHSTHTGHKIRKIALKTYKS